MNKNRSIQNPFLNQISQTPFTPSVTPTSTPFTPGGIGGGGNTVYPGSSGIGHNPFGGYPGNSGAGAHPHTPGNVTPHSISPKELLEMFGAMQNRYTKKTENEMSIPEIIQYTLHEFVYTGLCTKHPNVRRASDIIVLSGKEDHRRSPFDDLNTSWTTGSHSHMYKTSKYNFKHIHPDMVQDEHNYQLVVNKSTNKHVDTANLFVSLVRNPRNYGIQYTIGYISTLGSAFELVVEFEDAGHSRYFNEFPAFNTMKITTGELNAKTVIDCRRSRHLNSDRTFTDIYDLRVMNEGDAPYELSVHNDNGKYVVQPEDQFQLDLLGLNNKLKDALKVIALKPTVR